MALLGLWALPVPEALGTTYFVSNDGSDDNDGASPAAAWRTLGRVNAHAYAPGDVVRFRRGDAWRGQLRPRSGEPGAPVTYSAYGDGPKPLLLGSVNMSRVEDWEHEGGNIWRTRPARSVGPDLLPNVSLTEVEGHVLFADVGNIIFDHEASCGVKVWNEADLDTQGEYWYDEDNHRLKMYSQESPATHYSEIECALRVHIISQSNTSHVVYEQLALKYGGAHGIGGGNTHHIVVRDCDFAFIGGGDQHGGDRTVRFGNGVEFWGNAHDNVVERCRLWEIYDAALTNQNGGPDVVQADIIYRNNVIWNSEYSFEYWNRPESSRTENVQFVHNTCLNAGHGWGHDQRPDPSGRHLCFYTSPAAARHIRIENNIFCEARTNAFYAPGWPEEAIAALRMDHNCWHQADGVMVKLKQASFTMDQFPEYQQRLQKEPHSMTADPMFVDAEGGGLRLQPASPCIDAGVGVGVDADFIGVPRPQGRAPDIGAYELQQE